MQGPESGLLHEWLRRTAEARPDSVAIVEEDRSTSFAELLERSLTLSAALVEMGVRKGDRVALILPKTTDAIVSIFAALFAGAIYVPILPGWPKERIAGTLEDCAPRVVITAPEDGPLITARPRGSSAVLPGVSLDDAALILFTSGSTGKPKGVVLSHRAVAAFVKWTAEEFEIGPADRIASPAPLGFDLSTFDIFSMALCGATCVLIPDHIAWLPRFLVDFLRESRITCWYSVPSILAGMLQDGGLAKSANANLRLVLFAGEVFAGPNVARLQAAVPGAVCVNLYGPTETNVVTWHRVPHGFDSPEPPPIGVACPYAEVMLDASSGELLAGGGSTMSGYWNRPEETAQAFTVMEGKRYYRTGDRVTQDRGGLYRFVGRLDRQVKRRGFRIELGEIEAAFARHDAVLEAAAVSWTKRDLTTVIDAFVKLRSAEAFTLLEAKAHCARVLPQYMLPDRILFVDAIPKGNRGKIDYAALQRIAEEPGDGDQAGD